MNIGHENINISSNSGISFEFYIECISIHSTHRKEEKVKSQKNYFTLDNIFTMKK